MNNTLIIRRLRVGKIPKKKGSPEIDKKVSSNPYILVKGVSKGKLVRKQSHFPFFKKIF